MKRASTLIKSPLAWHTANVPAEHPVIPVVAERGGTQLKTPRGTVLVDTRERNPLDLSRFEGWFGKVERKALKLGDYSIAGLEEECVVERKDLSDLDVYKRQVPIHKYPSDVCVIACGVPPKNPS